MIFNLNIDEAYEEITTNHKNTTERIASELEEIRNIMEKVYKNCLGYVIYYQMLLK